LGEPKKERKKEVLIHQHHIFRKIGTARTQSKTGMVAYLGSVHIVCVGTVIILLYVTNITSNILPRTFKQTTQTR